MEELSVLLWLCAGNPSVTGGFPHKKASNADVDVSLNKLLKISQVAGDLRRKDTHVTSL